MRFDANSGVSTFHGPTMMPDLSVTFEINDSWEISLISNVLHLSQTINARDDLDPLLTNFEHILPALLSLTTGLSIVCATVELAIEDVLEARAECLFPPSHLPVINPDDREARLLEGIGLIGLALPSPKFAMASSYLRDAMFSEASYHGQNSYGQSLETILSCAKVLEILFGPKGAEIRVECKKLGVPDDVVESQIVPIVFARNGLGSGHPTLFVPTPEEAQMLRHFAQRSVNVLRKLLLRIGKEDPNKHKYLIAGPKNDPERKKFLLKLAEHVEVPEWSY